MKKSTSKMAFGAISLILGLLTLFNPVTFTIAVEIMVAWSLVAVGASQLVSAFSLKPWKDRMAMAGLGVLTSMLGFFMVFRPVIGVLSLTVIIAIFLLLQGVGKAVMAFRFKKSPSFWALLLSAILTLALALMIFNNFPQSALSLMGVFLSIELMAVGIHLLALGRLPDAVLAKA